MIITIESDHGFMAREMCDDATWGEAMDAFLDCLRGQGYVFSAHNEDMVNTLKDMNGTV